MKVYVSIKLRYAIAKFDTMLWGLYAKSVYLVVIMSSKTSESEQKVKKSKTIPSGTIISGASNGAQMDGFQGTTTTYY